MDKADIPFLSATELSGLIKRKEVSPLEATEAYLDRIDDVDFKFNAYLTVCRKEALQAARQAEQDIALGNYLGPMHGIPVAVKDQLWSKGIRSTAGSRILADFIPDEDATAVANLKRAGAILLGKTNLTEFAMGGSAERYSTPRNPWNLDMCTGSSSSGSCAATAAFLCATSLGQDTGGSIRWPAAWCGLVGLKPSWGRVSRYGVIRGVWSMDTIGPISRTVEDAAITLGAIAGHDPKDPYTWNTPVPDYRQALDGDIKGIRAALVTEFISTDEMEDEVRDVIVKAISVLGELGASVEEVSLPLTKHAMRITRILSDVEVGIDQRQHGSAAELSPTTRRDWIKERLQDYGRANRVNLLTGSITPAQVYYKAQKVRSLLRQQVLDALKRYDILVLPTLGNPAQSVEDWAIAGSGGGFNPKEYNSYILTPVFSLAGSPAITVPCGFSSGGLPIGLQIGGRPGHDGTVLKAAHAYERATPWHTMRPPAA